MFSFECSQAVPSHPRNKGKLERGKSVGKWTFIRYEERHEIAQGLYCVRCTQGLSLVVLTEEADIGENIQIAQNGITLGSPVKFMFFKSPEDSRDVKHE
jgi:hypothetical protein